VSRSEHQQAYEWRQTTSKGKEKVYRPASRRCLLEVKSGEKASLEMKNDVFGAKELFPAFPRDLVTIHFEVYLIAAYSRKC